MKIEKLQLSPAYKVVSDDLRQRIVRGEIAPGDSLPIESELAERYGVHRSTLREALRHLEQDGLVRRDGKKLLVQVPQAQDLARHAERALRMHQVTYRDVWELASHLEPLCAQLAAQRITEPELQVLEANLLRTAAVVEAGGSPVEETIEFHHLLAQASHNQALVIAHGPVSLLMRAGYEAIAPALPQSGARLLKAHRHIFAALQDGDVEAAVDWTRRHLKDHQRGCALAGVDMDAPIPTLDGAAG